MMPEHARIFGLYYVVGFICFVILIACVALSLEKTIDNLTLGMITVYIIIYVAKQQFRMVII